MDLWDLAELHGGRPGTPYRKYWQLKIILLEIILSFDLGMNIFFQLNILDT